MTLRRPVRWSIKSRQTAILLPMLGGLLTGFSIRFGGSSFGGVACYELLPWLSLARLTLNSSTPIWRFSYIVLGLSLGVYRKDWSWTVSLNWERVILLMLFTEGASPATHTMDVMSGENLPRGTAIADGRSFCSARWL